MNFTLHIFSVKLYDLSATVGIPIKTESGK